MDELEKVERLIEHVKGTTNDNISYEDARDALKACNGDMLDAIVYLEMLGKVHRKEQRTYSTSYEKQDRYQNVDETIRRQEENAMNEKGQVRRTIHKAWEYIKRLSLRVAYKENPAFSLPLWVVLILLLIRWKLVLLAAVIAMFFGVTYSLTGAPGVSQVNHFFDWLAAAVQKIKAAFRK